ncbi:MULTISPECIES: VWA domain-containing protein [Methylomicrobium]|uniref:Tetratricopeptide repeat protein,von Willebrand factor type A-like protein n=1 Tax=Methylomicrobium album BG8 TaxID=686340 RepID=H8GKI1_METAL|nr:MULTISPECIES: VWA domain-containing protein [Methylomicrobium]EIC27989.1 tetratricopeptide repeat protein,von Willebrand factor type A-like protein [Methylomicrobium album BG8]
MNLSEFHFIRPYWLLALVPAALIVFLLFRNKLGRGNWEAVCDAALLPYLLQEKAVTASRKSLVTSAVMALLAIVALAGPTVQRLPSPVFRNDSALVIALDLSRSMDAEDVKPSRLIRARYKIADLLQRRKDGQTALLVFAGDAFTVTPLTDDTETIASQLEALTTDIMPAQGSQGEAALNLAVRLLQQAGLPKGEILLITDGVEPDAALAAAKKLGSYRLSVLGVGTPEGAPIALPKGGFLKDEQGAIVVPKLHPDALAALAGAGGGVYRTLAADDSDIESVLAGVDMPVADEAKGQTDNRLLIDLWDDLGPWIVLALLPLAAFSFRRGLLCLAFAVLLPLPENSYALDWQDLWQTRNQQAAAAFAARQYDRAADLFEKPDWKAAAQYRAAKPVDGELPIPDTATGFYNQGNVLAKSGRFEEAIAAYDKSLTIDPDNKDAEYNKKLVEEAMKQQKQQSQQNRQQSDSKQQDSEKGQRQDRQESAQNQSDAGQPSERKDRNSEPQNGESQPGKSEAGQEKDAEKAGEEEEQAETRPSQEASAAAKDGEKRDSAERNEPSTQAQAMQPADETAQANQQWLNRVPDDPGGLLKRKFKYQYGLRQQRAGRQ